MKDTNDPVESHLQNCASLRTCDCGGMHEGDCPPPEKCDCKSVPVEKWRNEFDERFEVEVSGRDGRSYFAGGHSLDAGKVKKFISQALQAAVEEERKSIGEVVKNAKHKIGDIDADYTMPILERSGWNKACDYILSIIHKP